MKPLNVSTYHYRGIIDGIYGADAAKLTGFCELVKSCFATAGGKP